jgi:hypothetical protein
LFNRASSIHPDTPLLDVNDLVQKSVIIAIDLGDLVVSKREIILFVALGVGGTLELRGIGYEVF